jgi:large subunit ribosomal protein L18e
MNAQLQTLVRSLKRLGIEQECKLWKRIALDLERPSRIRRMVNVYKINHYAKDGDVILVPGKVCGDGELTKKITVAAYQFSESARAKIAKNGKVVSIPELMKAHPKGQKVRIIG